MTDDYRKILKDYWGYDNFRGIQEDIIRSIGSGRDTLGLMPTGGGKSITFQVFSAITSSFISRLKDLTRRFSASNSAA